ncbi:hypothetical protein JL721_1691 [Aureococcus anophagefferens]|nr:hypothetical protein JL721_1691 [Aureococcus anophagefferens]
MPTVTPTSQPSTPPSPAPSGVPTGDPTPVPSGSRADGLADHRPDAVALDGADARALGDADPGAHACAVRIPHARADARAVAEPDRATYTDGLYISGMSYDGHCVYKEQPDPTAAPTGVPIPAPSPRPTTAPVNLPPGETAKPSPKPSPMPTEYDTSVTVASAVVINGLDPDDFNAKTDMKTAFRKTIASIIQSDEICPGGAADYETCIGEPVATLVRRRRRLLSVSATVDFDMYASVEGSTGAVTAGDDILADVTTALSTSVSDGSFSSTLTAEAAATGGDASTGFASAAIDVTASTTAISASTVAIPHTAIMRVTWFVAFLPWAASLAAAQWTEISGLKTKKMTVSEAPDGAPLVAKGDTVTVHATGIVQETDKKFWSTKDPGQKPFTYQAGVGGVITGWDQGLLGAALGETRKLDIPAPEGYGARGFPAWGIPPNGGLFFEIEVLSIKGKGPEL